MKHAVISLFTLCLIIASMEGHTQILTPVNRPDTADYPYWKEMMQDPYVRFTAVQSAFYKYYQNRPMEPKTGWKIFKRWEYINSPRVQPDGKLPALDQVKREYDRYVSTHAQRSATGAWTLEGPVSFPYNATYQPTGMGRVNTIAFDPVDANIIYVGAPSGGLWKTTDGGLTWSTLTDANPTLGVSSIIVHPSIPGTILIGTGDSDHSDAPGMGVYKSTDGGSTWNPSITGMGNRTVGMMIMHPSNSNIILAATSGGVYKSTDGGSTWALKSVSAYFKDIKFNPADPAIVYATAAGNFYRSSNTGESFTQITNGILTGTRGVIGVSAAQPDYVYFLQTSGSTPFVGLMRSTDAGLTFSTRSTSPNIMGYNCDGSGTANQTSYDLCFTVDPNNANTVFAGGINNWKSTDGGVNWSIITHWVGGSYGYCGASVHADQHCYAWSPLNGNLYNGNDGGFYVSTNGGTTWTDRSSGIAISQIYKIGQSATTESLLTAGLQDNGTFLQNGTVFSTVIGGDGTESLIDYSNSTYRYGCYVYGDIQRYDGNYYSQIALSSNGITETGPWVTPYILHNTDPNTMFAGFKNVWRTNNIKASAPSSVTWSAISAGESANCVVLEQSPSNPDVLYVVRNGQLKRSDNANAAAASVTWTSCALPGGNTPTDLAAHPTDANIVYATASNYVYKSTDKGATWSNISGTLPAVTVNCIVYDKNANEGLYIGNRTGVYYRNGSMSDWVIFNTGLPVVDVRELEIFYDPVGCANKIKAGTYGRGLWKSDLYESGVLNPVNIAANPVSSTKIDLSWALSGNNNIILAYNTTPTFGTPSNGTSYAQGATIPGGGTVICNGNLTSFSHTGLTASTTYYYKIWSYNGSVQYSAGMTINAKTFCTLISAFPYTEGFEHSGSMPSCWTQEYLNGTNAWTIATTGTNFHPAAPHTGSYLARERSLVISANEITRLISPPIDLTQVANPVLRFWHTQEYWAAQDYLKIFYRTSASAQWTQLASYSSSIAGWTQENLQLPNPTATYFIAFEGTANAGYGVCIDDVAITTNTLTWAGSGNWTDYTRWMPPYVPAVFDNAVINSGSCTISSDVSCKDLEVKTGTSFTVSPTKTISVNGNIVVNP